MVKTVSVMLPLGTRAPDFALVDVVTERLTHYADIKGEQATVVMFICNHCPYVKHVQGELVRLAKDYLPRGVGFVAINSNDATQYPDDSPENMQLEAKRLGYPFAYLFDETQAVAKAYRAVCTPDFFVFDGKDLCVYRGQLDASRPGNKNQPDGRDMRTALDSILLKQPVSENQEPSVGCNIKWKE